MHHECVFEVERLWTLLALVLLGLAVRQLVGDQQALGRRAKPAEITDKS
jgi:hypothetical protein